MVAAHLAGASTVPAGDDLVLPFELAVPADAPCSNRVTWVALDAVVAIPSPYARPRASLPVNVHDPDG